MNQYCCSMFSQLLSLFPQNTPKDSAFALKISIHRVKNIAEASVKGIVSFPTGAGLFRFTRFAGNSNKNPPE